MYCGEANGRATGGPIPNNTTPKWKKDAIDRGRGNCCVQRFSGVANLPRDGVQCCRGVNLFGIGQVGGNCH